MVGASYQPYIYLIMETDTETWEVELDSPEYFAIVEVRKGATEEEIEEAAIRQMCSKTYIYRKVKTNN